jgi:uncharacterized membrane protein YhhN
MMDCAMISASLCFVGLAGVMVAEARSDLRLRTISKTTASLAMVVFALCMGAGGSNSGKIFLAGLVVSVIGDVFLLWPKTHFLQGVGAFLLAHCLYVGAFLALGVNWQGAGFALVLLAPIAWTVWLWLSPHTGRMTSAIAVYLTAISTMAVFAIGALWAEPGQAQQVLVVAAVLFCVSDLFVARNKFILSQHRNVWIGLPIYYVAQLAFGYGAGLI